MADDLGAQLRALANRWAMLARDYAREAKRDDSTGEQAAYQRGYAEGYYKAATELASILKGGGDLSDLTASGGSRATSEQASLPYLRLSVGEVANILQYAGSTPRDVVLRSDNSFRATFSKWEEATPQQREDRLKRADSRLIILGNGRTAENNDPYMDLAFVNPN